MRAKSTFLWVGMLLSLALCLLVLIIGANNIYNLSHVFAPGKLRPYYFSLARDVAVPLVIFMFFFALVLRERRALR
jgi:hypothetical protein